LPEASDALHRGDGFFLLVDASLFAAREFRIRVTLFCILHTVCCGRDEEDSCSAKHLMTSLLTIFAKGSPVV